MAREESDREDLLREATALEERIELTPTDRGDGAHVFAGFRANGAVSFFFGGDPVYQFNSASELRRAYCDGALLKAVCGRLVSLRRTRSANETQLLSRDLTRDEQDFFVARMSDRLKAFARGLDAGDYQVVGQVPMETDVLGRVRAWLATHDGAAIANSPRVDA